MDKATRTRRSFLQTSATGVAGLLLASRPALARVLGANGAVRVGVLGTGGRARSLMRQLKEVPGARLTAACDVYEPRRLEAVEIGGSGCAPHAEYRRVLDDREIDAVLIGAPDHWHRKMTLDALAAGKDVFLEKPISHALEEGEEMLKAQEASGRVVQTGTQQRSWEHFKLGKAIVDSGKLGQVTFVQTFWHQRASLDPLPAVETAKLDWKGWLGPAPERAFDAERFLRWRHFKAYGGGMLTDLLTHWIDVVHWYLDVRAPLTAMATGANLRIKTWEWPDNATATFEYPKGVMVTHSGTYSSSIDDGALEFRGDRATLKISREQLAVFSEDSRRSGPWRATPEPEILVRSLGDGSPAHLRDWIECIRSRKAPSAGLRVGHEAVRAAHVANRSLILGGVRVRFDEKTGKIEKA